MPLIKLEKSKFSNFNFFSIKLIKHFNLFFSEIKSPVDYILSNISVSICEAYADRLLRITYLSEGQAKQLSQDIGKYIYVHYSDKTFKLVF